MAAPKGNQFWKARSSQGPKPKYANPEDLWSACAEYFQWVEDNPLYEEKGFAYQGEVKKENFAKMRAMTIGGMCIFLDINHDTWIDWRTTRNDLSEVITRAEQIIRQQKFAGAAADLLNANIIARDLGLVDSKDINSTIKIEEITLTPKERVRRLAFMFAEAQEQEKQETQDGINSETD